MVGTVTWVFGGGGVGGIAWEIGVLAGLADEGADVGSNGPLLGTSAGSTVAAQLVSGVPIEDLYERQRAGVPYEVAKRPSLRMFWSLASHGLRARSAPEFGRRIGHASVAFGQDEAQIRRRIIEARLPRDDWGNADLHIVVVDADSGDYRVLTRDDGVPLVDAVMASCAVPLVWPVVTIGGHQYMDGGMRSPVNLDLAPGVGPVVALVATSAWHRWARLSDQRRALGVERPVAVLTMSTEVRRAQGRNPLNTDTVPAVALAGREQGRLEAARLQEILAA